MLSMRNAATQTHPVHHIGKVRTNYYPPRYLHKYNTRVYVCVLVSCITL